jgi:hypothetical protein
MSSYANALWATVQLPPQDANEVDTSNCHQPKSHTGHWQVQYIYSSEEFPSFLGKQKHQKTFNVDDCLAQSAMPQPSILTSPSQPLQTIPAAMSNSVDLDALEQAILTKFSDWLNQAVVKQVPQVMALMQAEINKISQMLQYMSE